MRTTPMALSNAELLVMTFLDSLGQGLEIPDGCDVTALAERGLISPGANGWALTEEGVLYLARMRATAAGG